MSDRVEDFRAAHVPGRPLLLPNAWDGASAAALFAAGFAAIGTTSLGVAAAAGLPDGTGAARGRTVELARLLAPLGAVTVDIEAGFGSDPGEVADLAEELAGFGVVGVNLEDGRPDGTLADPDRHAALVAAVKARCPRLFLNARTDAYWLGAPGPLPVSIERAAVYIGSGADGVFVPGATDPADIAVLTARIGAPVNLLFSPAGPDLRALAALGAARVSTGSLLFRAALGAAVRAAEDVAAGRPVAVEVPSYEEVQRLTA
ncbi:isocitrate lyase/PEP mutase family protein [Glycomyces paridis]|uniref:Isocitrate lyase/phosphoenolpyruvate mutase family protein n=1 Tax=Glycomyces paridis TaxID=2126555 RepID=A0A4S8PW15_9ACTN|nr:isocitrate lyase/phosphoenolpyruvate mutase family protein [Glycomyces paridis]THV32074.1 isocitrate lyase/phosphoenolpyruvate mutase family protein [Glycomyces paridis]